jgi:hypothetical protein
MEDNSKFFCSEKSNEIREQIQGTAPSFQYIFLLEYESYWDSKPLLNNTINKDVLKYMFSAIKLLGNAKMLFIKSDKSTKKGGLKLFLINTSFKEGNYKVIEFNNYNDILLIDLINIITDNDEMTDKEILYLVCTNGKKDKCCAKYGFPIYQNLKKNISNEQIWQCTHIGGDRFAPNIITFPNGAHYGHLKVDEIEKFLSTTLDGNIYLEKYRGKSKYNKYEQAAEYFLMKELQNNKSQNFSLEKSEKIDEASYLVMFRCTSNLKKYSVSISSSFSDFYRLPSCTAVSESRAKTFHLNKISS